MSLIDRLKISLIKKMYLIKILKVPFICIIASIVMIIVTIITVPEKIDEYKDLKENGYKIEATVIDYNTCNYIYDNIWIKRSILLLFLYVFHFISSVFLYLSNIPLIVYSKSSKV